MAFNVIDPGLGDLLHLQGIQLQFKAGAFDGPGRQHQDAWHPGNKGIDICKGRALPPICTQPEVRRPTLPGYEQFPERMTGERLPLNEGIRQRGSGITVDVQFIAGRTGGGTDSVKNLPPAKQLENLLLALRDTKDDLDKAGILGAERTGHPRNRCGIIIDQGKDSVTLRVEDKGPVDIPTGKVTGLRKVSRIGQPRIGCAQSAAGNALVYLQVINVQYATGARSRARSECQTTDGPRRHSVD